ncbi:hypothetical protein QQ008_20070 [Fulvivirgaceae bacterium BMA10]|uniref:Uncharacterized protein n=1 Tax=Splendidivirga corallicola TaxID=3051826 RepID=A0ABT8KSF7_9BACT|nr:hypothetical protein [Fulvivirgaceae bacterium BMA10]
MKLIVVLGRKAFKDELSNVFKNTNVPIYSEMNIKGIKSEQTGADMQNWFGGKVDPDFSVMLFAFVPQEAAASIMHGIDKLNESMDGDYPFHAFQLAVEQYTGISRPS